MGGQSPKVRRVPTSLFKNRLHPCPECFAKTEVFTQDSEGGRYYGVACPNAINKDKHKACHVLMFFPGEVSGADEAVKVWNREAAQKFFDVHGFWYGTGCEARTPWL